MYAFDPLACTLRMLCAVNSIFIEEQQIVDDGQQYYSHTLSSHDDDDDDCVMMMSIECVYIVAGDVQDLFIPSGK